MSLPTRVLNLLDSTRGIDFLGPLALRLYLAPIFILAGYNKLSHIEGVTGYFDALGLPAPAMMAWMAGLTELLGGCCLVAGFAVRWVSVPLMFTMIVAATTVHWENGWHVLPEAELTVPWEWQEEKIEAALERRDRVRDIAREHGHYTWLTEHGNITILKNGIEFAATYFIMLLTLFFIGGGRYFSLDYWVRRSLIPMRA